jgi:hypothetical protein
MTQAAGSAEGRQGAGLLAQRAFRRYALAKGAQQTGQNALVYGLFIAYIAPEGSALVTSAFVLASVVPSILLSMPGGVFGDAVPKKLGITGVLVVRILIVAAFIRLDPGLEEALGLTVLLWAVYQFYTPPENVALLAVVDRERLPAATSLIQGLTLLTQLTGAGLLAPLVLKLGSREALFYAVGALLAVSLVLYLMLPALSPAVVPSRERVPLRDALRRGLRVIWADRDLRRMTVVRATLDTGMMMVLVAAPVFIEESLRTGAVNAVYIAIPGAAGMAAGLLLAPVLVTLFRPSLTVGFGYVCFLLTVLALAFVGQVSDELADLTSPLADAADAVGLSREVFATALVLPVGGFGAMLVQVGTRVAVLRVVSPGLVAQVLAGQSAFGSLVALAPTFLAGVLFDIVPVDAGLFVVALALAAGFVVAHLPPAAEGSTASGAGQRLT